MNDKNKKITTQESIEEGRKKPAHSNDFLLENIQKHIGKTLSQKASDETNMKKIDAIIDEYADMKKNINSLKNTTLSDKDNEFLYAVESFYLIFSQKDEIDPKIFNEYLRNAKDNIGIFFLKCVLNNDYDIAKNPLRMPIDEIISLSGFIGSKFIDDEGNINRGGYAQHYVAGKKTKFVELLEHAKKDIGEIKKENINLALLARIFDKNDRMSPEIFAYILHDHLGFTEQESVAIKVKYIK